MEVTRRDALVGALFTLLPVARASAMQQPTQQANRQVFLQELPNLTLDDWQVTASEITMAPGGVSRAHRHPGFVLAYVLEGRVRFAINGEPERTVPSGGTFFEPLGAVHTTSGSASATESTRILVFEVRQKE